jgi:hypothetical protein
VLSRRRIAGTSPPPVIFEPFSRPYREMLCGIELDNKTRPFAGTFLDLKPSDGLEPSTPSLPCPRSLIRCQSRRQNRTVSRLGVPKCVPQLITLDQVQRDEEVKAPRLRGFSRSPLTDSNRRPPLYEEGPCVKLSVVGRLVRAGVVGVVGVERCSSLYRLLDRGGQGRWGFAPVAQLLKDRQAATGSVAPLGAKRSPRLSMCQIASVSRRARSIWATLAPRCLPIRALVWW